MYSEIDEYLDQYDGKNAYEVVKKMIAGQEDTDVGLECRLAHACYILSNFCLSKNEDRCNLLKEAYTACKMAYEIEPKNAEVLKWSAIISGTLAELADLSSEERVTYIQEFKRFLDQAMALSPDSSVYHMNGRFHYRLATLSNEEKLQAISAFGMVPETTVDEALNNLHKAEELNPGHIDNLVYLAKCYIAKGNSTEAQKYLIPVLETTPVDDIDEAQIAEAYNLMANILKVDTNSDTSETEDTAKSFHTESDTEETEDTTDLSNSNGYSSSEEESEHTSSVVSE